MYDLFVIGAGPGGYEAAGLAAHMGRKVALAERQYIGGTCLNAGCIPAKTYLRAAKLLADCKSAAAFGVRVASPELDLPALVARKNRIVGTLTQGVENTLKRRGVEIINGHAVIESPSTVSVGDASYDTRSILIATGSRPAVPPIPGIDSKAVLDSTSIFEITELPKKLAIIGAGYIGLEFASFFAAAGCQVVVFEMLPHIAAGCDREIADRLQKELTRQGVEFRLSAQVAAIENRAVHLQGGSFEADHILNATGRVPAVENLGLENVGVDSDRKGIKTSDRGKTNVPGIWACGDVTGRRLLAHAAAREGHVAVYNMFGVEDRVRYDTIPSVIYTHPEVASVGKTEEELRAQGISYRKSTVPMAYSARFMIENPHGTGLVKVLAGAAHGELLGVHAVGDLASEFIIAAAAMLETEWCVSDVAQLVFPHPTVSEAMKEAILRASGQE